MSVNSVLNPGERSAFTLTVKTPSDELKVFLRTVTLNLKTSQLDAITQVQLLQTELSSLDEPSLLQRIHAVKSRIITVFWKLGPQVVEDLRQKMRAPQLFSNVFDVMKSIASSSYSDRSLLKVIDGFIQEGNLSLAMQVSVIAKNKSLRNEALNSVFKAIMDAPETLDFTSEGPQVFGTFLHIAELLKNREFGNAIELAAAIEDEELRDSALHTAILLLDWDNATGEAICITNSVEVEDVSGACLLKVFYYFLGAGNVDKAIQVVLAMRNSFSRKIALTQIIREALVENLGCAKAIETSKIIQDSKMQDLVFRKISVALLTNGVSVVEGKAIGEEFSKKIEEINSLNALIEDLTAQDKEIPQDVRDNLQALLDYVEPWLEATSLTGGSLKDAAIILSVGKERVFHIAKIIQDTACSGGSVDITQGLIEHKEFDLATRFAFSIKDKDLQHEAFEKIILGLIEKEASYGISREKLVLRDPSKTSMEFVWMALAVSKIIEENFLKGEVVNVALLLSVKDSVDSAIAFAKASIRDKNLYDKTLGVMISELLKSGDFAKARQVMGMPVVESRAESLAQFINDIQDLEMKSCLLALAIKDFHEDGKSNEANHLIDSIQDRRLKVHAVSVLLKLQQAKGLEAIANLPTDAI